MRIAFLLAGLALASTAAAQIPIPAFGNTYQATQTRGYWFQAPVGFTIQGLSVPNEALQPFQVVEVINLGAAPPAYPGTVVGTQLFYDNSTAGGSIIPCNIPVAPGDYIGVLGACTSTVGNATSYNSYATPAGAFTSSILGNPVTLTRFGTQSGIGSNGGNQPCWQEAAGQISRVELYVGTGGGNFALAQPYGTGCYNQPDVSFYENFATGAFDLSNSQMTLVNIGTGYLAIPGLTTYVAPSATATVLALTDDSETTVTLSAAMPAGSGGTTTQLTVCSNGFISSGVGNGTTYTPAPATFLASPRAWWSIGWHDLNPATAGSGQVKFEEIAGIAYVTWDGVWDFGGASAANANTFQAQFELATGNVHYVFGAMSNLGNGRLTGFSDGGTSADPGSMDISAALPATFPAATFRVLPLTLGASARPVIGTSINLVSTNVPLASTLGATIFGLVEITNGLDLTSIGMPGCSQYLSLDSSLVFFPAGGTGTQAFGIPNSAGLSGVVIKAQSAAFSPGANALGVVSSNGMRLTIDIN